MKQEVSYSNRKWPVNLRFLDFKHEFENRFRLQNEILKNSSPKYSFQTGNTLNIYEQHVFEDSKPGQFGHFRPRRFVFTRKSSGYITNESQMEFECDKNTAARLHINDLITQSLRRPNKNHWTTISVWPPKWWKKNALVRSHEVFKSWNNTQLCIPISCSSCTSYTYLSYLLKIAVSIPYFTLIHVPLHNVQHLSFLAVWSKQNPATDKIY